ncbi:MAG TPA: glycerol-3-phosphate dehydrogenase [Patescibacteria group bacterium]|nr:glycerol-3-phosphate dehydrogenase [Patescibacteria group bacterium]
MKPDYDLVIIGGGINGAGIARDAAGRGLKVLLVEAQDLAGATSSASTKLIHGGLRYLEYYEFHLVAEALKEREVLLGIAPHLVSPLEFVLPHEPHLRPAWMIRAGLYLYDHLAKHRKLPNSKGINLSTHAYGQPLLETYKRGFTYADCRVDDARLVVLNVMDAAERSATILTRTICSGLRQESGLWQIQLTDIASKRQYVKHASMVVNAAGPWVRSLLDSSGLVGANTPNVRLVKGSHLIVPRLYGGEQAYILQQPDRRIIFAIPWQGQFTMVGTTDENFTGDPSQAAIEQAEVDYLCSAINRSFRQKIGPENIVATWSGVRPLVADGHDKPESVTRDYKLILDRHHGPPLLSIFGGKITTYRRLAEEAVNELCGGRAWTGSAPLPGGDIPNGDFNAFLHAQELRYPWLPEALVSRYAHAYGTRMDSFIGDAKNAEGLGKYFGDGIYEAEVRYLVAKEWARTMDDLLWRRSKLRLFVGADTIKNLERALPRMVREITGLEKVAGG